MKFKKQNGAASPAVIVYRKTYKVITQKDKGLYLQKFNFNSVQTKKVRKWLRQHLLKDLLNTRKVATVHQDTGKIAIKYFRGSQVLLPSKNKIA